MNKVQLFQDRILTDAERLALATGAATYRCEDPSKAPVKASMLPPRTGPSAMAMPITEPQNANARARAGPRNPWGKDGERGAQLERAANPLESTCSI